MKSIHWKHIQPLFEELLNLNQAQRNGYLDELQSKDPDTTVILRQLIQDKFNNSYRLHDHWASTLEDLNHAIEQKWIGQTLGKYQIEHLISTGGIGAVFTARRIDKAFEKTVAIKLLRSGKIQSNAISRFINERQIQAQIEHPYIARVLDGGTTDDGMPYIVMEHITGKTLTDYCQQHGLGFRQRIGLFIKVCDAVDYLHKNLVIHSDIKSDNIIVDTNGIPKLLDFGIAKLLDITNPEQQQPETHSPILTLGYASPEQLDNKPLSTASDVYSLAMVLSELINDDHQRQITLLSATDSAQTASQWGDHHRQSTLDTLCVSIKNEKVARHIRDDLHTLIEQALAKNPDQRIGNAFEFRSELESLLANRPLSYRNSNPVYKLRKFAVRNVYAVLLGGVLSLATIAFAISTLQQFKTIRQERDTANFVTNFMADTFLNTSPLVALDKPVTASELLENASQRIAADLNRAPEHQARLLRTIATAYEGFESYEQAESLLNESIRISRAALGDTHEQAVRSLFRLALIKKGTQQYAVAEQYLREVVQAYEQTVGRAHTLTIATLYHLGDVLYAQAQYTAALSVYEDLLSRINPATHPQNLPITLNGMGNIYRELGKDQLAQTHYLRSMDAYTQMGEPAKLALTIPKENLAMMLLQNGQQHQARQLLEEAIVVRQATLPVTHSVSLQAQENLAMIQVYSGDTDGGIDLQAQILDDRRTLDPSDPKLPESHYRLAALLLEANQLSDAQVHAAAALTALQSRPASIKLSVRIKTVLGLIALEQGNNDDAEQWLLNAQQQLTDTITETTVDQHRIALASAQLYANTTRCQDTKRILKNWNTVAANQAAWSKVDSTITTAACLYHQNQPEQADQLLDSIDALLAALPKNGRLYRRWQALQSQKTTEHQISLNMNINNALKKAVARADH